MSQPDSELGSGLGDLRQRRAARAQRRVPEPKHPRTDTPGGAATGNTQADGTAEIAREIPREVAAETGRPVAAAVTELRPSRVVETRPAPVVEARTSAPVARRAASDRAAQPLPNLDVDLTDPAAMMVTPTVLSIPGPIMHRFEAARAGATSHTALVLNALRAHAEQLPALVLARRPGPRPGDLFPYRAEPGEGSAARPAPLRIRPTAGELNIMDGISAWVNGEIHRQRPGGRKVSRSEVVAVALDEFLPPAVRRRGGS